MNIVSYDTGKLSGIGMWRTGDGLGTIWSIHLDRAETEAHMRLSIPHADVVIVEKLTINAQSHKKTNDLIPAIELAGVAVHYARIHEKEIVRQSPGDVMSFATDAKLKRVGWYVPGKDHQRDARRHIMTYIAEHRLVDATLLIEGGKDGSEHRS